MTPFSWPLEGEIGLKFGDYEDGVPLKGLVFQTREGEPVKAAADGVVQYADEHLKGYGKTLIVRHSEEFSTVYARNSQILVSSGQSVRRGEVIAKAGSGGRVGRPQLYFEVRRQSKAEDPLRYLS